MAGLSLRFLDISDCDMDGFDIRDSTFQGCIFGEMFSPNARIEGSRFYNCKMSTGLYDSLKNSGIALVDIEQIGLVEDEDARDTAAQDPVSYLVSRFFRRFMRRERGQYQATVGQESVLQSLASEERKFTQREIIRRALSEGIIRRVVDPPVYVFNSEWQTAGDALVFDEQVVPKLRPLVEQLREASRRYSLA
ncbi:MAG: hypothetical protein IH870_00630 [Chloroflexi bacterium]|nr:hypothetical protein [Chloroflexota bacterium]